MKPLPLGDRWLKLPVGPSLTTMRYDAPGRDYCDNRIRGSRKRVRRQEWGKYPDVCVLKFMRHEIWRSVVTWWRHQMEKRNPLYWPFVLGIHRSPAISPHKSQWRGTVMFSLICAGTNGWVNNRDAGDLRRHRAHYDVNLMSNFEMSDQRKCIQNLQWPKKIRKDCVLPVQRRFPL